MSDEGWEWDVVPRKVERACPTFPSLGEQALNATNNVSNNQSELEVCRAISGELARGTDKELAVMEVFRIMSTRSHP